MRNRLPLILSATALVIAVFGSTPLGQAAENAVAKVVPLARVALFANNAGKLNGHKSSTAPKAGQIPVLDSTGKLPASIVPGGGGAGSSAAPGPMGPSGPAGATGPTGASGAAGATNVVQRFGTSVNVLAGQSGTSFASCNAGEHVVGGGYFTQGPQIVANRPFPLLAGTAPTSWQATLSNTSASAEFVGAYAMCAA